eukprot:COSAG02_NODE_1671_length_11389_cov_24.192826_11_plen_66_part_00
MEAENEVELALNRTWRPQLAVTVRAKIQHVAFSKLNLKSRFACGRELRGFQLYKEQATFFGRSQH